MATPASLFIRALLSIAGGLPLLLLSAALVQVWIAPLSIDNGGWLRLASTLIFVEFVLLHSGVFMATGSVLFEKFWQRLAWFIGFGLLYFGGVIFYARWTGGDHVQWLLFAVLVSRIMIVVFLRDKKGTMLMMQRSIIGMTLLLLTAFICIFPIPPLGISEDIRYATFGQAIDALSENPQRTVAWGAVYFCLMAAVEFFIGWKLPDWTDKEAEAGWKVLQK